MSATFGRTLGRRGIASALTLAALFGCRAGNYRKVDLGPAGDIKPPSGSTLDPSVNKTEFHRHATKAQEFNLHIEMARALERQGSFEAAIGEYKKAVEASEKEGRLAGFRIERAQRATAERRMGAAFDRLGRFAQAEAHYRNALRLAPNDSKVWNDAGYSYYVQSRPRDAERCLRTALRLAPDDNRARTNLGLLLATTGKTNEALEQLTRAGGPAAAHANLGYILAATGDTVAARPHFQTALELQPDMKSVREALAQLDFRPPAQLPLLPHEAIAPKPPALAETEEGAIPPPVPVAIASPTDDGVKRSSRRVPIPAPPVPISIQTVH
ncbi:MAG: tetratricopeptide repeat protein [Planctomycetota bacterium]|nr:tetratricopeptide repeat protein [Planctomycetota bacterium]